MTEEKATNKDCRQYNILLGVTGSVAAVKAPEIALSLYRDLSARRKALDIRVRILLSAGGKNFWQKAKEYNETVWKDLQHYLQDGSIRIHESDEEWRDWNTIGDPVLHIDLRDWADVMLIAPLSAHTLAKLSSGLCDDTLSCVARAWDFGHHVSRKGKPLLLAPAMNTAMWDHPLTRSQLLTIQQFWNSKNDAANGVVVINPQVKTLACGEVGDGALASVASIVDAVEQTISDKSTTGL